LGNLTSQLFANIYMNELDQYVKNSMGIKYYIRYTDDFVIIHHDEAYLRKIIFEIASFLNKNLRLNLHPRKVSVRKANQGIDYLGYIVFPHFTLLRTRTKKRLLKNISNKIIKCQKRDDSYFSLVQTVASYSGILNHCRGFGIHKDMASRLNQFEIYDLYDKI
jgi:RNA-directed DNA polymerase